MRKTHPRFLLTGCMWPLSQITYSRGTAGLDPRAEADTTAVFSIERLIGELQPLEGLGVTVIARHGGTGI